LAANGHASIFSQIQELLSIPMQNMQALNRFSEVNTDMQGKKGNASPIAPVFERLAGAALDRREVYLWGPVSDESARVIIEQFLYLEAMSPSTPIFFFINSPGGVITSGMAIYDVMRMISSPVYTIAMGFAASMGATLLTVGEKGYRYVFQHSKVLIHQPLISGQIIAPAIDLKIHAEEIRKTRQEMNRILSETTGQPLARIEKDTDRDYNLSAQEAVAYGLADRILTDLAQLRPDSGGKNSRTTRRSKIPD